MNKSILMGRLTKDPEVRYTQSAEPMAIANYTLAVPRRFKRENEPDTDFIPCVAFGKSAEFAEKYFKKGLQIAITGRIQIRSWENSQGQKHWTTEVIVEEQDFADSKKQEEEINSETQPNDPSITNAPPAPSGFNPFAKSNEPFNPFANQNMNKSA